MSYQKIEQYVKTVRNSLKKGRFREALTELEKFIEFVNDSDLDDSFVALSARFSKEVKDEIDKNQR